jgi:hypothetical protein
MLACDRTETWADPLLPSLVAVTVALPEPTAVAAPSGETVTTDPALVVHETARPPSKFPA